MAATKSTKSRKASTKKTEVKAVEIVESSENIAEEVAIKEEITEVPAKKEKRKFHDTDVIPCLCSFPGTVIMHGKRSGNTYLWEDMGVVEYVEYQDLRSEALNKKSSYIYKPLIIIEDEDFLEQNKTLCDMYENIYTPQEIVAKIKKSNVDDMKKFIMALPSGIKENVKNIASTMIQDGTLDSIRKIKAIDNIFETELNMYSQFFSDEN